MVKKFLYNWTQSSICEAKAFNSDVVDDDVDFVGGRLKHRFGLPFPLIGFDVKKKKRAKIVDKNVRRDVTFDDVNKGASPVFRKLTDFLVEKFEIPIVVEAVKEDRFLRSKSGFKTYYHSVISWISSDVGS